MPEMSKAAADEGHCGFSDYGGLLYHRRQMRDGKRELESSLGFDDQQGKPNLGASRKVFLPARRIIRPPSCPARLP
eukprot:6189507-Pleurochrysis_carterae.AAC.1